MGSLRWGILGPGGIAGVFAHDLRAVGLELVAWPRIESGGARR